MGGSLWHPPPSVTGQRDLVAVWHMANMQCRGMGGENVIEPQAVREDAQSGGENVTLAIFIAFFILEPLRGGRDDVCPSTYIYFLFVFLCTGIPPGAASL